MITHLVNLGVPQDSRGTLEIRHLTLARNNRLSEPLGQRSRLLTNFAKRRPLEATSSHKRGQ